MVSKYPFLFSAITPPAVSDAAVCQQAEQRLAASPYPALRRLDCDFHEGVLTLRGRVPSYYHKQIACTLLCDLEGVEELIDRLEVVEVSTRRPGRAAAERDRRAPPYYSSAF